MAWTDPITNRRPTDLAQAIINPRMLGDSIGARNISDLNRIAANSVVIRNKLISNGKSPPGLTQKMVWLESDLPHRYLIQRILTDVKALRSIAGVQVGPSVPELPLNTFWKMNDLEEILARIWDAVNFIIRIAFEDGYLYSEISENMQQYIKFDIIDGILSVQHSGPLRNMKFEIDGNGDLYMIGEVAQ